MIQNAFQYKLTGLCTHENTKIWGRDLTIAKFKNKKVSKNKGLIFFLEKENYKKKIGKFHGTVNYDKKILMR